MTQRDLIGRLNLLIRGWTRYYATVAAKATFAKLATRTYTKLWRWAKRRHPHKSRTWIAQHYWHPERGKWDFATEDGERLYLHTHTPIIRHVKVTATRSPYDGDWIYWTTRLGKHPDAPRRIAALLRKQNGRCAWCGLFFKAGDLPETDHILPRSQGGKHHFTNWQLIHRHCHDQKTARDAVAGTNDNGQMVEEPDEANVSRPVLKPSGGGDSAA
jgi:RNA-directed DNA polymerase